jgi:uncharacterized protein
MNTAQLLTQRRQKDEFFKNHPQSPLTPEQRALFTGLRYYEPHPDLDLTVTVIPFDSAETIDMQTTSGTQQTFARYGEFTFQVDNQTVRLTIYEADYGFFLPFVDTGETYPAGRYLEPEHLGGDQFHVDLNQAYNPYCAYNDGWTCPITPAENRLTVAIEAGEKLPQGDWVSA